jgi:16S rRNA (adenine1518-N6/adenine1519-N6)-dimethyltransferase
VGPGDDVVEIGAGLGSLTRALAEADADRVLAIEFDRKLLPALAEAVAEFSNVRILAADASKLDWEATLGEGDWTLCANLPYNVATPLLKTVLAGAHAVRRLVVMVQTEVGDRLVATPGQPAYGPLSIEVAYHAAASFVRSVPPEVFWPRPKVGSVVVRLERLDRPPVDVDHAVFRRVVATAFTARRKTIRAALRPLTSDPDTVLATARVPASARPGTLSIEAFARIAEAVS